MQTISRFISSLYYEIYEKFIYMMVFYLRRKKDAEEEFTLGKPNIL